MNDFIFEVQRFATYSATASITSAGTYSNQTYASTSTDENAVLITATGQVNITNPTVTKSGGPQNASDDYNFYGINSAVMAMGGGTTSIVGGTVTTNGVGANGIFSYGGNGGQNGVAGDGTTVIVSDVTITTTENGSGGIMTTGGGKTIAYGLNVSTSGGSSAPIRTDRGGGNVTVNGGTYTSSGLGSPAIYSTAEIVVNNASLKSDLSEGVCIEGLNSVAMTDCTLTASNTQTNGNAQFLDSVILYQSMSGDSATGTSTFSMNGGVINNKSGHVFHVTNTTAVINLNNVTINNEDSNGVLLSVCDDGWSGASNIATLNLSGTTYNGDILVGNDSTLTLNITDGATLNGGTSGVITNAAGTSVSTSLGTISVSLDSNSYWALSENTSVSSFSGDASHVLNNGYSLFVNGTALDGTTDPSSDIINNTVDGASVVGTTGDDTIKSTGANVTINALTGNDSINVNYSLASAVIQYAAGDGNDTITGYTSEDKAFNYQLSISGYAYTSAASGANVIIGVGTDSITIQDAISDAGVKGININGSYRDSLGNIPNSAANVTVYGTDAADIINNKGQYVTISAMDGDDTIENEAGSGAYIDAGAGNDYIDNSGGSTGVTILGGEGADTISNSNGANASIIGGAGADSILTQNSNDVSIIGGAGNDIITLDDGVRRVIQYNDGDGNDSVIGFTTSDTLIIGSGTGAYSTTTSGNDIIVTSYGGYITLTGAATLSVNISGELSGDSSTDQTITGATWTGTDADEEYGTTYYDIGTGKTTVYSALYGMGGNDKLTNDPAFANVTIDGGEGNDQINNRGAYGSLIGGEGNDYIENKGVDNAKVNNSTIEGGAGADVVDNLGDNVSISVGDGADSVYSRGEKATITGGAGADTLNSYGNYSSIDGGEGDDNLIASGSNVTVHGGEGNDTLQFSGGSDSIAANGIVEDTIGNNYFHSEYISTSTITGGDGKDTLYSERIESVTINLGAGNNSVNSKYDKNITIQALGGDDTLKIYDGNNIVVDVGDGANYIDIENLNDETASGYTVTTGTGNDTVYTYIGSNALISTGDGNDSIGNSDANATINGGDGDDYINNGYGYDYSTYPTMGANSLLEGGKGNDSISNSGENVTLDGGDDDDELASSGVDNILMIGGDGNDTIRNLSNINRVTGKNVTMLGGAGNDYFYNLGSNATINGGTGDDTIFFTSDRYGNDSANVLITYANGDGNDLIQNFNDSDTLSIGGTYSTVTSGDDVILTVGDGKITLEGAANLETLNIVGGEAVENWATVTTGTISTAIDKSATVASGTTGDDTIKTEQISGDTTARLIEGNGGNDSILNFVSNVTISGGADKDSVVSSADNVVIQTGGGNDYIQGATKGNVNITIDAGDGDDEIDTYGINASINGGAGNDSIKISADSEKVTVIAGEGSDTVVNTATDSFIDGGAGSDSIHNNSGNVTIDAGADDDVITSYGDKVSISGGAGADKIIVTNSYDGVGTISGGIGDDTVSIGSGNFLLEYTSGDGSDVINGFKANDTLYIDGKYSTATIGTDLLVTVGSGILTLQGAATLESVNVLNEDDISAATFVTNLQQKTEYGYPVIAGLFFHPTEYHGFETLPSSYYASSETLTINSSDGLQLTGYHYTPENPNDKWVILVHGYGHNHKHMNGFAMQYLTNNYHVLEIDQRAAGDSQGEWLTMGAAEGNDVALWTQKIAEINSKAKITLHGVSMGAATAMLAAANSGLTNVTSLVEDCGYTSVLKLVDIVKSGYPALGDPEYVSLVSDTAGKLTGHKLTEAAPIDSIGSVTIPSMFITGTSDVVVSMSMLETLYAASGAEVKEIFTVEGATHGLSALTDSIGYGNAVFRFNAEAAGEGWITTNVTDNISLRGTKYDDTITNSGANVTIDALGGDDTITNSGSNVSIDAGDGENLITESGNNNHIVFNGNTTVDGFNYGFGDGADTVYFNVSKKTSAPACDFKEGGIVFYNSNASLTFADKTDTTKLNFYYAPETQHVKGIFIPDDTWYTATSEDFAGNAELYFVGASAKINHGVDFSGISDALNISLDTDYEATNISYWVNNVYSVKGGAGLTTITGSTNNDTIIAGTGAITINGGKGDDYISLSSGAAIIQYTDGDGNDVITGFDSNDTLTIGDGSGTYSTNIEGNNLLVNVGENVVTLMDAVSTGPIINGIYNGTSSEINNTLDNTLVGGTPADDTISNHGSNVTISALGGNDFISNVNNNNTYINGGAGNDFILNSLHYELVTLGSGQDTQESLSNPYSGTTIEAGVGDDTLLTSGGSTIRVAMGDGNDYIASHHSYYQTIDGGAGNDRIEITEGHHENISGGEGADTIIGSILFETVQGDWAMGGYSNIDGGAGADYISVGYSNNATINGGADADTIITYGPNSTINGGAGNDSIVLISNGEDTLNSDGTTITGGAGNDTISISDDSGVVVNYSAGDGDDVINGITANDTLVIDGDTYRTTISGNDKIISVVGSQNTITLKDAANIDLNIVGTIQTVPTDKSGTEIENPVAMIASGDATYYYESVARATNDADNNSTVTVTADSTETSTINTTKNLSIQFAESGLGVYSVTGGNFISADSSNAAQFTIDSSRILSNSNSLLINNGATATVDGYVVTGTSSGYTFNLQDNVATINSVAYNGTGTATFDTSGKVTLTSGAIVNDEYLITSDTGIVLAAGNYTLNGNAFATTATQTVYLDSDGAHFNVTSDTITYNSFTLNGSGAASISGDLPTLTAGVEVNRDERAMVVLTEKGYNTINGRGYQMTEKLSEGITVGAVDNGIGAAHIIPYESFPEDAGKLFAEEALIYGDDSYTVRLNKDGIKSIYGISAGSSVRGTAYFEGEVDTLGSILQLAIDGSGAYTFGDKTYTINGAIDSVNVAALTSRFYNDNTAVLKNAYYLNGTISGDFSSAVTINQASMPLQVLGDNLINIVATDSVNASVDANSSKISSAGNVSVITGLNSGATVAFAGGATKVTTEEEGSFVFRSSDDTQQAFTVSGDSSVDFILRNYTDENGKPTMQVEGVNNFENGYYSFNSDTAYHGINVGETIKASDELEMVFSDVATFTIADSKVVSVGGIDGTINNLTSDVTVHATGAMTVNKVYANVTGDTDYNILVENSTTTGLVNISSGASVSVANIFVTTDNNGDFKVGENVYSVNDTVDNSVTFVTGYNGAVENVTNFAGSMKTSSQNVTVNGQAFTTSNTDASIISAGTGISRVEGLTSGDTVSGNLDTTTILMPSTSDSDVSTLTITNTSYTLANDANGVEITGKRIDGLDYGASLQTNAAGVYTVNGTTLTAKVGDIFIGTSEGAAYIYDPNNIPLDVNTMTNEEIAAQAGISNNYSQEETNTALANSMLADDGDKSLNGNYAVAIDNTGGNVTQTVDFSNTTGRKKVTLGGGAQDVSFNNEGGNVAVISSGDEEEKNVNLGNGGDLVIVEETSTPVNINAGTGSDSIVTAGNNVNVNMNGGATKIIPNGGTVNLNNYDASTGAGIQANEYADIARAVVGGNINFGDGGVSFGGSTVYFANNDSSSYSVNMFDNKGKRHKVGYTNSAGGNLDTSGEREGRLLVGNKDGNKGASTFTAGSGDDTAIGGAGDNFDLGAGNNTLYLNENRDNNAETGATINQTATSGKTEVNGFSGGFNENSDRINIDLSASVSFKNGKLTFTYLSATLTLNFGGSSPDLAESADLIADENFVDGTTIDEISPITYEQGDYQFGAESLTAASDYQTLASAI